MVGGQRATGVHPSCPLILVGEGMAQNGDDKLRWRLLISAWWGGAWDGRRRQFVLPQPGDAPLEPPMTPAIGDRFRRAEGISEKIFGALLRSNDRLIRRINHQISDVIYESRELEHLTPAAVGRLMESLSAWAAAVGVARNEALREATDQDLWIGRYWRALSSNHKGLRRRRPPHLDGWGPERIRDRLADRWAGPDSLLVEAGIAKEDLRQARRILGGYRNEDQGEDGT